MHSASLGFNHIYGVIASAQQIKSDKSGSKLTGNFHITNPEIELKKNRLVLISPLSTACLDLLSRETWVHTLPGHIGGFHIGVALASVVYVHVCVRLWKISPSVNRNIICE